MNVLLVGSGGREHALAWKIKQSPLLDKLYCAPGNGGIEDIAECVDLKVNDIPGLLLFAKEKGIDLTVVGPEVSLVDGIVDVFEKNQLMIFGPSKKSAQLEGSKAFAKEFMHRWNIPTAQFKTFNDIGKARGFIKKAQFPIVIKADGLAAGKGVIVCKDFSEGERTLSMMMEDKAFSEAGNRVVIEEFLEGEEVSIIAVSDGKGYSLLSTSQDHKRIFDDDLGPNTGGMGAYSPAFIVDDDLLNKIDSRIIEPTLRGMKKEGMPFKGVLYAGLMLTKDGPKTLEYNVRFGDPEAQAILPRMKNDIVTLMLACCEEKLSEVQLVWDKRSCICVVISSGGYPGEYQKGYEIKGLDQVAQKEEVIVFHAGTKKVDGKYLTNGGRVFGVSGFGRGIEEAIEKTYKTVEKITFKRCFFRRDIGAKAIRLMGKRSQAASR